MCLFKTLLYAVTIMKYGLLHTDLFRSEWTLRLCKEKMTFFRIDFLINQLFTLKGYLLVKTHNIERSVFFFSMHSVRNFVCTYKRYPSRIHTFNFHTVSNKERHKSIINCLRYRVSTCPLKLRPSVVKRGRLSSSSISPSSLSSW